MLKKASGYRMIAINYLMGGGREALLLIAKLILLIFIVL